MDRRTADATEQWLHSLLQSLDASPRKSSHANSTHEIRLGTDGRLVTLTFAVKDATAPAVKPQQEQQEWRPWWLIIPVCVLGGVVGSVVLTVGIVVYCDWLGSVTVMALNWLGVR